MAELFDTAVRYSGNPPPVKKPNRFFLYVGILMLILAVPVTIISLNQQQKTQQQAQLNTLGPHDSCNKLTITWQENITGQNACITGQNNSHVSKYGVTITVKSNTSGTQHSFHYLTYQNFCPQGSANPCVNKTIVVEKTLTTPQTITIPAVSPPSGGMCGTYQDDFVITAIDNSGNCHYGNPNSNPNGSSGPGGAGYCATGVTCKTNTPTPTPTPPQSACVNTIPLDAKSSTVKENTASITWSHPTGSHNNTILFVGIASDTGQPGSTSPDYAKSVLYNGTPLTKLKANDCAKGKCGDELWYMKNPPSGTHDIVVTLGQTGNAVGGAATFYNVNMNNPLGVVTVNTQNGNPTVTSNTSDGQVVFDTAALDDDTSTLAAASDETNLWGIASASKLVAGGGASKQATGTSTTSLMKATSAYPEEFADIAVPLNPIPKDCTSPTPTDTPVPSSTVTPTPSDTPTPTPSDTPTPTACVTPAKVTNVKVTCSNCSQ